MIGIIKRYALKECTKKDGKTKFSMFVVYVDVKNGETKEVKTYSGTMSIDWAKKYFDFCGKRTAETIGKGCEVVLRKRFYEKDGKERYTTDIKFFNLLNEDGKAIIMPKDGEKELSF